ncbi:hypothetical protein ACFLTA_02635 [Bacteroidota bacterium]
MPQTILIALLVKVLFLSDYHFVQSVDAPGNMHYSDPMGNIYIVKDNTLKKYSSKHVEAGHYSNAFLGNIYSVDVSDPLRILLFYKDHNQVVWVDNFLSEIRSPVWLDALGIDQTELVCSSNQGGFWVFNSLNNQLQYYDVNLQLVNESPSLNILTGPDISPTFMLEKSRSLYLNVPGTGILVFDRFGNYSRTLPVETPSVFQITDSHVYYMSENNLFSYNLHTAEIARLELPEDGEADLQSGQEKPALLKAELQPGMLFLYTAKGYLVYKTSP